MNRGLDLAGPGIRGRFGLGYAEPARLEQFGGEHQVQCNLPKHLCAFLLFGYSDEKGGHRMEITKLSTKGQIILPASIRAARDFQPGDEFAVEASARGIFLRPL